MKKNRKTLLISLAVFLLAIILLGFYLGNKIHRIHRMSPDVAAKSMARFLNNRADFIRGSDFVQRRIRNYIDSLQPQHMPSAVMFYRSGNLRPKYLAVAFGDSITAGMKVKEHQRFPFFMEKLIAYHLPDKSVKVLNAGLPGNTSIALDNRLQRDVIDLQPDLVILGFGFNDAFMLTHFDGKGHCLVPLAHYKELYESMVHAIREKTEAEIIIFSPPPLALFFKSSLGFEFTTAQKEIYGQYVQAAQSIAQKYNCRFASVFNEIEASPLKKKAYHRDGVHPTVVGNILITHTIYKTWLQAEGVESNESFVKVFPKAVGRIDLGFGMGKRNKFPGGIK